MLQADYESLFWSYPLSPSCAPHAARMQVGTLWRALHDCVLLCQAGKGQAAAITSLWAALDQEGDQLEHTPGQAGVVLPSRTQHARDFGNLAALIPRVQQTGQLLVSWIHLYTCMVLH